MIQVQTLLRVVDNSGGKLAKCIKIRGKLSRSTGNVGDVVVVAVRKLRKRYRRRLKIKVSKRGVYYGVIIQTKKFQKNFGFTKMRFNRNAVTLISPRGKPLSTRIFTRIPRILRQRKWGKFGSLARGFF